MLSSLSSRTLLRFAVAFAVPTALVVSVLPREARAADQAVSDADRAAARELYFDGVRLQDQGKFDAALERFTRAQAVFSAPTHLLHIAECQAALGHLVESAETYRILVRTPLPTTAPHAFLQAQQQGNAELTQVEPRIPSMKLRVKPENLQGLTVQVDGQPMSAALVGVSRPTNPGDHTITVYAPGYAKTEQKISLREREQKDVAVTLQPSSGVVYGPSVTSPPPAGSTSPPPSAAPATPPPQTGDKPQEKPIDAPPPYDAPQEKRRGNPVSFLVGPRLGGMFAGGNYETRSPSHPLSEDLGAGFDFGVEAGLRFARVFYAGAVFEHAVYGSGSAYSGLRDAANASTSVSVGANTNYFGVAFAWISNPDGVGFYGELGAGYRWLNAFRRNEDASDSSNFIEQGAAWRGVEGALALGVHIKAGSSLRLIPKIGVNAGSFAKADATCKAGGTASSECASLTVFTDQDVTSTDTHTFVFIGMTAFFDIGKH